MKPRDGVDETMKPMKPQNHEVSTYTKSNLCDILLFGEKPHIPEKFQHNKLISFAVQRFLCRTQRLYRMIEANKPINLTHADPTS